MTISEIIEALEKAEGPDRELDRLIHFHIVSPWLAEKCAHWVPAAFEEPNDFLWWTAERKAEGKEGYHDGWESVTSSVDAALELLKKYLPGWRLCFEAVDGIAYDLFILGPLYRDDYPERESSPPIAGKPIAMALVLATLKALQAKEPTP